MAPDGSDIAQGGQCPIVLRAHRPDVFVEEFRQERGLAGQRFAAPGKFKEHRLELALCGNAFFHKLIAGEYLFGHGGILIDGAVRGFISVRAAGVFVPVRGANGDAGLEVYRPHAIDVHPHAQADPAVRRRLGAQ